MADDIDLSVPENKGRFLRLLTKVNFDLGLERTRQEDPKFDPDKDQLVKLEP